MFASAEKETFPISSPSLKCTSEIGSTVLIVNVDEMKAVVKVSANPVPEMYTNRLLSIYNAKGGPSFIQALPRSSEEFRNIKKQYHQLYLSSIQLSPEELNAVEKSLELDLSAGILKHDQHSHVLVMDFISGATLPNLSIESVSDFFGARNSPNESGIEILKNMGHLFAFDLLVNNQDRFPCLPGSAEGNLGNIMIDSSTRQLRAIDNVCVCVGEEERAKHFELLDKFIRDIFQDKECNSSFYSRLDKLFDVTVGDVGGMLASPIDISGLSEETDFEAVMRNSSWLPGKSGRTAFREGFLQGLIDIVEKFGEGEIFRDILATLDFDEEQKSVIVPEFFCQSLALFKKLFVQSKRIEM